MLNGPGGGETSFSRGTIWKRGTEVCPSSARAERRGHARGNGAAGSGLDRRRGQGPRPVSPAIDDAQRPRPGRGTKCVETARTLMSHATQAHRDELRSFAVNAGIAPDLLTVANTIMDLHRGGFACSSLMVEPGKSRTGGMLFGRNLDFYSLGVLDRYGLITVHRPTGKRAFATRRLSGSDRVHLRHERCGPGHGRARGSRLGRRCADAEPQGHALRAGFPPHSGGVQDD